MNSISQYYHQNSAEGIARFSIELAGKKGDLLSPVAPMAVRQLIEAQEHARIADGGNVRTKILFHASFIGLGWVASVAARVIRVVFRTVFAPISLAVAAYQQQCYGPYMEKGKEYNLVLEDAKRIGKEWVDLVMTAVVVPVIGTVNFFAPQAIPMDQVAEFYADRIEKQRGKDETFFKARDAYNTAKTAQHNALKSAREAAEAAANE